MNYDLHGACFEEALISCWRGLHTNIAFDIMKIEATDFAGMRFFMVMCAPFNSSLLNYFTVNKELKKMLHMHITYRVHLM